jgi:hypothetical protein
MKVEDGLWIWNAYQIPRRCRLYRRDTTDIYDILRLWQDNFQ